VVAAAPQEEIPVSDSTLERLVPLQLKHQSLQPYLYHPPKWFEVCSLYFPLTRFNDLMFRITINCWRLAGSGSWTVRGLPPHEPEQRVHSLLGSHRSSSLGSQLCSGRASVSLRGDWRRLCGCARIRHSQRFCRYGTEFVSCAELVWLLLLYKQDDLSLDMQGCLRRWYTSLSVSQRADAVPAEATVSALIKNATFLETTCFDAHEVTTPMMICSRTR